MIEKSVTELIPVVSGLENTADRVRAYLRNTRAPNTYKAYAADWRDFETWCAGHGVTALQATPPTVMLYLAELGGAGKSLSTVGRRVAALAQMYRASGQESPTGHPGVRELLAGMRRTHGTAAQGKEALLSDDLRAILRELGDSLRDRRDRALLLLGFAGAFRRSELVALQRPDIRSVPEGLAIQLRRSKSDQEGHGREVAIPFGARPETCTVCAFEQWIAAAGIEAGPVFRGISRHGRLADNALTPAAIALLVKERAVAAGLDPAL